jgi:hypothetical protein
VNIGANVLPTAPALGGLVTLTLPPELRLLPESLATLTIEDAPVPPLNRTLSADSSTITFIPSPNADSFVVVSGVIPRRLAQCCTATRIIGTDTIPGYAIRLTTTVKVTTAVVSSVPSTVNTTTPAVGEAVTLTSTDASFTFLDGAVVVVGADIAITNSVAGDGSSVTFTPTPGATGTLTVDSVDVVGFPLTLASTAAAITVSSTIPTLAGTDDPATAPAITVPAAGERTSFFDAGSFTGADITFDEGVGAQYYQFTITEAGDYTFTTQWSNVADVDGIICSDVACSDGGAAAGDLVSQPEEGTLTLTAGTYYYVVVLFEGEVPDWINPTIGH